MIIYISKNERLTNDKYGWMYQLLKDTSKEKEVWVSKWFYSDLESAYISLLDSLIRTSSKETLKEALEETVEKIKHIEKEIRKNEKL